jgi:hypothetical protein
VLRKAESDLRRTITRVAAAALCCVTWMAACVGDDFTSGEDGAGGRDGDADGGADATAAANGGAGGAGGQKVTCEPVDTQACTECLFAECQEIACDCWAEPDCGGLFECYADPVICPDGFDEACVSACLFEHADGISAAALANDCALDKCFGSCESTPPALDDCEVCLYSECSGEMNECLSNAQCRSLITCTSACDDDVGCTNLCKAEHPDWVAQLDKIQGCAEDKCQTCN